MSAARSNYNIENTILFLQKGPIKYSTEARLLFTGLMRVCHAIVWSLYAHSFLDMISLFYYSYSRFQEHVINPLVLFPSPNAKPQVPPKAYVQTNPGRKTGRHHSDMMYDYIPIQQITCIGSVWGGETVSSHDSGWASIGTDGLESCYRYWDAATRRQDFVLCVVM